MTLVEAIKTLKHGDRIVLKGAEDYGYFSIHRFEGAEENILNLEHAEILTLEDLTSDKWELMENT